jgi:glycosyltransferase involved in cell wall biosynthesis
MKTNKTKIKVVLLCHFTNKEIQAKLNPRKNLGEFAPWIPMFASIFENQEMVDLTIISPHEYITGVHSFTLRGVNYYFYNAHMPIIGRHWPGFFKWDLISKFLYNKFITRSLINKIKPELIHLFGAENDYYSSTLLQFKNKYPVLISIQGFIYKSSTTLNRVIESRINTEFKIITNFNNHAIHTKTLGDEVLNLNSKAKLFHVNYPIKYPNYMEMDKKYDIVFFARISKDKGIGDLIQALAIIKIKKIDISLCVIGGGSLDQWKEFAVEQGVSENIYWAGFLPTQADVHEMASQSKISVLPTYHDMISGTILESLFLKLPVVAYNVGSIHEVNAQEEIISLVEKLDIEGLAKAIEYLLDNPEIAQEIAEKGYNRAHEMFVHSDAEIKESLMSAYYSVIKEFKKA